MRGRRTRRARRSASSSARAAASPASRARSFVVVAGCRSTPAREPTIASTIRRSPSSWPRDLLDDAPARHDDDAVAQPGELERVARLDDGGDAFVRLRAQRLVDVEARADVDALRRLLGEDDLDVSAQERADERHLLLVAAGERLDRLLRSTPCGRAGARRARRSRAARGRAGRRRARASRRSTWMVAFARTLRTGNSASPRRSPLSRTTPARSGPTGERVSSFAPSHDALPIARSTPASARRNCTWPLPSAPAIPRISPFRDLEVDRAEALAAQARHREHDLGVLAAAAGRSGKATLSGRPIISATSASSEIGRRLERPLADAVAEHRDAVGDREHLGQAVADVDDADALACLLEHERVEPLDLLGPECRRRLVEEQHLRPGRAAPSTTSSSCRSASESEPGGAVTGMSSLNVAERLLPPSSACARTAAARRRARRG